MFVLSEQIQSEVKTVDQLLTSLGVKEHEVMINYDIFKKKGA